MSGSIFYHLDFLDAFPKHCVKHGVSLVSSREYLMLLVGVLGRNVKDTCVDQQGL